MSFAYEVLIKENHLDSYGHVNNAAYLALYEEARWELVTSRGYGYQKVHELGQGPVILEVHLKFLKEIRLREKIKITVESATNEGKIFKIQQKMLKENGDVASEALIVGGFFDLKARKLIFPSEAWLKALGLS